MKLQELIKNKMFNDKDMVWVVSNIQDAQNLLNTADIFIDPETPSGSIYYMERDKLPTDLKKYVRGTI